MVHEIPHLQYFRCGAKNTSFAAEQEEYGMVTGPLQRSANCQMSSKEANKDAMKAYVPQVRVLALHRPQDDPLDCYSSVAGT